MLVLFKQPIAIALAVSLVLHTFMLFGIGFALPDPRKITDFMQPLQVVLVNSKSKSSPVKADALAQHNLDGGGNTTEDRRAKSPLPALNDDKQFTPEQSAQRVQQLEQGVKLLLAQAAISPHRVPQQKIQGQEQYQKASDSSNNLDLVQRKLEIARLEAQISKDFDTYQKLPRRKFIGARTQEYRFAQYVEDWRIKVERIGNMNYPQAARQNNIYGKLQLSVSIRADGSLENVEVSRSSRQPILDAAARQIVQLAAPFAPLPPDIRKDTDILTITRTWTFTSADTLQSE
ncbi:energy transducer TonB [Candidatus Nitrotoga sp. M5]|uniref:energy transducer TonB n=1 Tax=Candidatus Nitrotoga sp. M5 TaxID=2890409 RepID=UPI001EF45A2A|nr:energy transducer TonB [Candidatus Nitrotoga sp. M5]CAH1387891.1 Protein TonB [Candidatus Nitrotoga sp. M5]